MKKVLIDINVLLDFLVQREFHEIAAEIVDLCFENHLEGYLCAHEVTTMSYFLDKHHRDPAGLKTILTTILDGFRIIPADATVFRNALLSSLTDFEDAVIETSAYAHELDCIITRNIADFRRSRVPALLPEAFMLENPPPAGS